MTGLPVTQSFYGAQLGVSMPEKVEKLHEDYRLETAIAMYLMDLSGSQSPPTGLADRLGLKIVTIGPDTFVAVNSTYQQHKGPGWTRTVRPESPSEDAGEHLAWVAEHFFTGRPGWVLASTLD